MQLLRNRAVQSIPVLLLVLPGSCSLVSPSHHEITEDLTCAIKACQVLNQSLPQLVSFPGSKQYDNDTSLFFVSSEQNSTCSIEPRNENDVSAIIKIVGNPDIRAPFAVKSGGHGYNLGQSSTPGVQVSMARFTNISFNAEERTVSVGVGLTWEQVYKYLEPLGVMVAGGRINSVGVGGYSLGGGYSWKTNQVGLLIDTIVSYELVIPSGELMHVTNTSNPELFFALKGGLNNFGIVTEITLEAHDQTLVYGGTVTYSIDTIDSLNNAVSDFTQNNTDPKAQMIIGYGSQNDQFAVEILLFYDAPTPAVGVYDAILSIPKIASNLKTRSFVDFMSTLGGDDYGIGPFGAAQHVVPIVQYTKPLLDEIVKQVNSVASKLAIQYNGTSFIVSFAAEPFTNAFSHSRGGAYPHPSTRQVTPGTPGIIYQLDPGLPLATRTAIQASFVKEIKQLSEAIQARAIEEGVSRWDDILYPNYALLDTPLELLYGSNVPRLQAIAARYDPGRVMSLTGGFHFQS